MNVRLDYRPVTNLDVRLDHRKGADRDVLSESYSITDNCARMNHECESPENESSMFRQVSDPKDGEI